MSFSQKLSLWSQQFLSFLLVCDLTFWYWKCRSGQVHMVTDAIFSSHSYPISLRAPYKIPSLTFPLQSAHLNIFLFFCNLVSVLLRSIDKPLWKKSSFFSKCENSTNSCYFHSFKLKNRQTFFFNFRPNVFRGKLLLMIRSTCPPNLKMFRGFWKKLK